MVKAFRLEMGMDFDELAEKLSALVPEAMFCLKFGRGIRMAVKVFGRR